MSLTLANPSSHLEQVRGRAGALPEPVAAAKMIVLIEEVRKAQDSIGGIYEVTAHGVPPGWGEPVFDKLKADLAKDLLSLPAVTFEYGAALAWQRRSANNTPHPQCRRQHWH